MKKLLLIISLVGGSFISAAQPTEASKQNVFTTCAEWKEDMPILVGCGAGRYNNGLCKCYIVRSLDKHNFVNTVTDGNDTRPYKFGDHNDGTLRWVPLNRIKLDSKEIVQQTSKEVSDEFPMYIVTTNAAVPIYPIAQTKPDIVTLPTSSIGSKNIVYACLAVGVVAIAGYGSWWFMKNKEKSAPAS